MVNWWGDPKNTDKRPTGYEVPDKAGGSSVGVLVAQVQVPVLCQEIPHGVELFLMGTEGMTKNVKGPEQEMRPQDGGLQTHIEQCNDMGVRRKQEGTKSRNVTQKDWSNIEC